MARPGADSSSQVERGAARSPLGTLAGLTGASTTVTVANGEVAHGPERPDWLPNRGLVSGDFNVLLEDSDPFRDCYELPTTDRLTASELATWQTSFDAAWHLIEAEFSEYVPGLRAGLS